MAQSAKSKTPETTLAWDRHHGMENKPAPKMLFVRFRMDGKTREPFIKSVLLPLPSLNGSSAEAAVARGAVEAADIFVVLSAVLFR